LPRDLGLGTPENIGTQPVISASAYNYNYYILHNTMDIGKLS